MKPDANELERMLTTLDLSDAAIARRKAFLDFGTEDVARLERLHQVLQGHAPQFATDFYRHILSFSEMRALLPDTQTLERLERVQAAYFGSLTAGDYDRDYFVHRLRVGMAHHRVGLAPRWYLGAYAKYLGGLLPEIQRQLGEDSEVLIATVQSLIKIVLLDMGIAIETYIEARDQTIQGLESYADMVLESMYDGILVLSSDLEILSANPAALAMFGLTVGSILGRHLGDVLVADGLVTQAIDAVRGDVEIRDLPLCIEAVETRLRKQAHVTFRHICSTGEQGTLLLVIREVSEEEVFRKQAESRLLRSEALLRHAQSVAKIGSWRMEPLIGDANALEWSDETYRLFGLPPGTPVCFDDFLGKVHPDDRNRLCDDWHAALRGAPYCLEHRIQVHGATRWVEERAELSFDSQQQLISVIGTVQDITERKIAEMRIEQLAFYDELTGLPNRALFHDRLQQKLATASRHGTTIALLFMDLDRFKEINDTQGHACGDEVLVEVAQRFRRALRHDETLARLGGDEFVVIADEAGRSSATIIAERLKRALIKPISVGDHAFTLGASTGIALYPNDGNDCHQLLKHADIAMYRAKANGGTYCFYSADMGMELARRLEVARRFARAMNERQLHLHYQPQCELHTGTLTGAEALLRWHDAEWGWVSPSEFIPIAEERGLMIELGEWVLREACTQLRKWAEAGLELPKRLAINVSARQIEHPYFAHRAVAIAAEAGVSPSRIELEITESSMMLDPESAMRVTRLLVDAGFAIAIDDFGTGHSSLSYLKRFPAQTLKIDMSFVRHMLCDRNDHSIVTTIIAMSQSLGLKTLAEGVEEAAQAESLLALGCVEAQGYYFGRPAAADQFAANWLGSKR